ncbi:MAG: LamG domain-containing protein [Verrucomicrobiia bacterium]
MNSPSFVNGVRGSAVYLKGSGEFGTDGQYVQLPPIRLADYPSFTVALWAKIDGVTIPGSHETIIGFGTGTCGPPNAGRIAIDYSAGTPTELTFESGGPNAYVLVRPIPSGCWGNWAHYTLVYDSGELKAFVNGRLVATKAGLTAGQTGTDAGLGITRWNTAGCPYGVSTRFIGAVSELRIYNRALSPNEIAQLAKSGKTALNEAPTAPPLPPPAAIAPPLPAVLGGADHRG